MWTNDIRYSLILYSKNSGKGEKRNVAGRAYISVIYGVVVKKKKGRVSRITMFCCID